MSFYQQTLDYYNLNGRVPMSRNMLIDRGGRSIRASDANVFRSAVWGDHHSTPEDRLNTTFHCRELDCQMPMWWMVMFAPEDFFRQRESEIEKGQGRVKRNYQYAELGRMYQSHPNIFNSNKLSTVDEIYMKQVASRAKRSSS